ncbi:hypothetical protein MMC14_008083 [Varicellaria rhodocarpa]|nr:hypothetical protein [Varicellaria rhodocarpa]
MSPNDLRYITSDGGPPMGGRAPGMALITQEAASPRPPPPPYSIQTPFYIATGPPAVTYQATPTMMYLPQPTFTVATIPTPPPPQVSLVCAPPLALPAPAAPSDNIPGETLRGSKMKFADGTGFLFPETTTEIHFITNGAQPWSQPNQNVPFVVEHVDVSWTVRRLISRLGIEPKGKGERGIAECFEGGNGTWTKGGVFMPIDETHMKAHITLTYGSAIKDPFVQDILNAHRKQDGCNATLESLGWNNTRGTTAKPVWLALCEA